MKTVRTRWLMSAVALLLVAAPAWADKEKAKEHFRKGMAKYTLERWDEAIREFEDGYTEEPDPSFLYNIAQAHRLARRPKPALDFYKKFLNRKPDAPNRAEIEEHIAALQKALADGGSATPPPPPAAVSKPVTPPPPPPPPARPEPVVVKPTAPTTPTPTPTATPPATPTPTPPAVRKDPVPAGAQNLTATATPPAASSAPAAKSRWPLWVGIAAGAVVLAGGAATAGILLGRDNTVLLPAEQIP